MTPSYKSSMLSQMVLGAFVIISVMQLYYFFMTMQILPLFASLVQMLTGAYFQKSTNFLGDNLTPENLKPIDNLQSEGKSI